MFLIDKPFVSDFLIKTIRDKQYKIIATPEAKQLISEGGLNWISEEEAIKIIRKNPDTRLYTNSENSIAWIVKNLEFTAYPKQIQLFKNKATFRELIKDMFPGFFYRTINYRDIAAFEPEETNFPFVIKPVAGFFSLGVHVIHTPADWKIAQSELTDISFQSLYPREVLDTSGFIIEEYIEGEEYAMDCYFNNFGRAVVLSIYHHKFSSGKDVSDRVYSTSEEILFRHKKEIEDFLNSVGKLAELRNFPVHVEIRIDAKGKIRPIEFNPLRFGGWCTTADLSWYAFGFNSYEYYMESKVPDWEKIFKNKDQKIYSLVILNNNSGYKASEIDYFDFKLLEKDFEKILITRKTDINKQPLFAFLFTETSMNNKEELDRILVSDLRKYIITR